MIRLFTALLLTLFTALAAAADSIVVENAWIREAPPGARMLAGYMVVKNLTDTDARLVSVDSPAFAHVMMHKSETVDGMARMIHQDSLLVPAHDALALQPGSFHLMMPAPEKRLTEGDTVKLMLRFADERRLEVTAVVRKKP
jgi:copper(I)-binding protein